MGISISIGGFPSPSHRIELALPLRAGHGGGPDCQLPPNPSVKSEQRHACSSKRNAACSCLIPKVGFVSTVLGGTEVSAFGMMSGLTRGDNVIEIESTLLKVDLTIL